MTHDPTTIPSADQVRVARLAAGLTLQQAAQLAGVAAHQRWAEYENGRRSIDAARWELFLLKAGLHPTHRLIKLDVRPPSSIIGKLTTSVEIEPIVAPPVRGSR